MHQGDLAVRPTAIWKTFTRAAEDFVTATDFQAFDGRSVFEGGSKFLNRMILKIEIEAIAREGIYLDSRHAPFQSVRRPETYAAHPRVRLAPISLRPTFRATCPPFVRSFPFRVG